MNRFNLLDFISQLIVVSEIISISLILPIFHIATFKFYSFYLHFISQEKKEAVTRTSSIENALNSIDSAFDFLSEHQTMKPDKKKAKRNNNEVCPNSWKVFKKVGDC